MWCTQHRCHRDFEEAVGDALCLCFCLSQADVSEFGIGEEAERNLPARRDPMAAKQIVSHHTEIVEGDVREVRTARAIADRPNSGGRRFQALG